MRRTTYTVTIASIWPLPLRADRPRFFVNNPVNTSNVFEMEAGSAEKPAILKVGDFSEMVYVGAGKHNRNPVTAEELSADLVHAWRDNLANNLPDNARPGIWTCEGDVPTKEEIDQWLAKQNAFAQTMVQRARIYFTEARTRPYITTVHYAMGKFLRLNEPWQTDVPKTSTQTKTCPFCQATAAAEAAICGQCKQVIDKVRFDEISRQIEGRVNAIQSPEIVLDMEDLPVPIGVGAGKKK